jgi:gliding motility-associated-like protein
LTGELVETIQRSSISVTATEFLNFDDHTFLQVADEYQIQISQINQLAFCEITSDLKDLNTPRPLFAQIGPAEQSYPDLSTGSISIVNFDGGIIDYDVRIELDSASSPALPNYQTDWEEVLLNGNNQFEKTYSNVPPGRYSVEVIDSIGCVIELVARVKMDQTVYIPNIFTPNDDGVNDTFYIRNLPVEGNDIELIITSRWGKEVFSTKTYENNWSGEGAADGIYFYQLSIGGNDPITGWVEIMRGEKP